MLKESGDILPQQERDLPQVRHSREATHNPEVIDFAREAVVGFEIGLDTEGNYIDARTGNPNKLVVEQFSRMKYGDMDAINFFAANLAQHALANEQFLHFIEDAEQSGRTIYITSPGIFNVPSASNLLLKATTAHLNIGLSEKDLSPVVVAEQTRLGESVITYASKTVEQRVNDPAPRSIIPEKFKGESVIFLDDLYNSGTVANRAKKRLHTEAQAADAFYLFGARVDTKAVEQSDGTIENKLNTVIVDGTLPTIAPILHKDTYEVVQKLLQAVLDPKNRDELYSFLQDIPTDSLRKIYVAAAGNDYRRRYERKFEPSIDIVASVLRERKLLKDDGTLRTEPARAAKVEYQPEDAPYRLALHSIDGPEDVPAEFGVYYSRMKYGDPESVSYMAESMADKLLSDKKVRQVIESGETLMIAGSAYKEVPTAASVIAQDVIQILKNRGIAVDGFKIDIESGFSVTNYGAMSKEEREACLKTIQYNIDDENKQKIAGRTALVIDDLNATGSHEKIFHELLKGAAPKEHMFGYLIDFSDRLAAEGAHAEDVINHNHIQTVEDVATLLREPTDPSQELVINARTIKLVLTSGEKKDLHPLLDTLEDSVLAKLYNAATAADGYSSMPTMIAGFQKLENYLLENGLLSIEKVNERRGRVTLANLTIDNEGNFIDMETGENKNELAASYSRMKYGSVPDIKAFGSLFANKFIQSIDNEESHLRQQLEHAKENGEFISFVTPGVRNVEHGSAFAYEEALKRINVELALRGLPTIVPVKLPRLEAVTGDYAKLNKADRSNLPPATDHILPGSELYQFGVHMLFGDDVRITGVTADAVERSAIKQGAISYMDMYDIVIDPQVAAHRPEVENFINHTAVSGELDNTLAEIMNHEDFRPVQRLLRLVLNEQNRAELHTFLSENITDQSLIKLYMSSLGNDLLKDEKYAASLGIMKEVLHEKGIVDAKGHIISDLLF